MPGVALAKRLFVSLLSACLMSACSGSTQDEVPTAAPPAASPPGLGRSAVSALPDFTALVDQQGPAVVNVVTTRSQAAGAPDISGLSPDDPLLEFFRRFIPDGPGSGGPGQQVQGLGSGFIISPDGLILTNAHVVADASSVTVRLADGKREFAGKVLGADLPSDVAVVKIEASGLPVAKLGNSKSLRPGQWVAAIGSPFGFTNTITAGIVSATKRDLPDESTVPFIQSDVAVNPGNSGGPLINMAGEVVGINSMIYSGTGGYMGVSFAVPIETALDVAKQLQEKGKVTRGRLGIAIQPLSEDLAQAFRLKGTDGVLVNSVDPGGPAGRAGLKNGDIILAYNGQPITNSSELPRLVAASPPGSSANLAIWRDGGRKEVTVKVGEAQAERPPEPQAKTESKTAPNRFGLALSEVPPPLRKRLGIDYGLMIEAVEGAAAETPLRRGDVIVAVNQSRFASWAEFNRLLAKQKPGEPVAFLVRRRDITLYVTIRVPAGK